MVYFMPAVLGHANEEELHIEQSFTDPAPLIIHFKCGFVPVGVFCAMIASLVSQLETLRWTLLDPSYGHTLCKNKIVFRISGAYDLTLISKPKWYEIYIVRISTKVQPLENMCRHVLETVCDTLDQVISKMRYKQFSASSPSDPTLYELGFKCPKHPNDDHLVINTPMSGVEAPSQSAKSLWLNHHERKSVMICQGRSIEGGKAIDLRDRRFSWSFAAQSLVWFGEITKAPSLLPDSVPGMRPPSSAMSTGARSQPHLSTMTGGYVQQVPYPEGGAQTQQSQPRYAPPSYHHYPEISNQLPVGPTHQPTYHQPSHPGYPPPSHPGYPPPSHPGYPPPLHHAYPAPGYPTPSHPGYPQPGHQYPPQHVCHYRNPPPTQLPPTDGSQHSGFIPCQYTGAQVQEPSCQGTEPTLPELMKFTCTDGKVVSVPVEVATKYVQFGAVLLDNQSGSKVKIIAHKNHCDAEQINIEIFQEWLNGRGKTPVTWTTLVEALYDIELSKLAGDIKAVKCPGRPIPKDRS